MFKALVLCLVPLCVDGLECARREHDGWGDPRRFSCSWPTTSRHLRVLEKAGLVRVDKQGREWVYVLETDRIRRVVGGWIRWFEPSNE